MKANLEKRLQELEAQQTSSTPNGWPPLHCDLRCRLAKYRAWFENRPWECTGSPERVAQREAALVRYKRYFIDLESVRKSDESR